MTIPNREELDRPIVYRNPVELMRFENTVRKHTKEQLGKLAQAYREFGPTNPILIDEENRIIAGEGRQEMCRILGVERFPCIVIEGLSAAQKKALRLADNRITQDGTWDNDALKRELAELEALKYDLDLTGFEKDELSKLLRVENESDPDETPEVPVTPLSQLGDVWIMGRHRIVCGDCTISAVVSNVLGNVKPNLMVTDPPYGVDYDPSWRTRIDGEDRASGVVVNDDEARWLAAWKLFPGDIAYIWHGDRQRLSLEEDMVDVGFRLRNAIHWVKPHYVISRGDFHSQHETCLYMVRKGGKGTRTGLTGYEGDANARSTVWQIDNASMMAKKGEKADQTGHGTQKPVECMRRPIRFSSSEGHAVYDPFAGSGSTIMACETEGRACHAIEISPAYVDVSVHRWQNFSRRDAIHEETGMKMHELAEQRGITLPPVVDLRVKK